MVQNFLSGEAGEYVRECPYSISYIVIHASQMFRRKIIDSVSVPAFEIPLNSVSYHLMSINTMVYFSWPR